MIRYRSDIDGLRAIAVLLVMVFHAGIMYFPAGFIGVDIFFVISGFLISSIIASEIGNNRFSVVDFYIRRMRRLQPALIVVIFITLLLAIVFYLPEDFIAFVKSAKYTTLFTSNQYFAKSTTAYAASDTAWLLLLHTWSLSIEWQWYLFLPVGLILGCRYLAERWITFTCLLIYILATSFSLYLSYAYPDKSYYFLSSRIFEFMAGVCVATPGLSKLKVTERQASISGFLALIAIGYCATRTDILLGYPDYHAVMVSMATAVLIFVGSFSYGIAYRLLSLPPVVFIGTISYSLYLWHWPVFALCHYLDIEENTTLKIFCFIITAILACLSYLFIEKPFRKKKWSLVKSLLLLVVVPAVFFSVLFLVSKKYEGFNARLGAESVRIESTLQKYASPYRQSCLNGNTDAADPKCIVGYVNAKKRALLVGDSNANHFWSFFDLLAKDAQMSVMVQGTSSCLTLPDIYLFDWWYFKNKVYQDCHDNTEKYYQNIKNGKYDYVILGAVWGNYSGDHVINQPGDERSLELSRGRIEVAMEKALDIIIGSGARPVIIKSIYAMPEKYMSCFYRHIKLRGHYSPEMCRHQPWNGDENEWFSQLFVKMKQRYPSLIIIDPKDAQCAGKTCSIDIDGIPVYRDVGHLTDYASYEFGKIYLRKKENPFK